MKTIGLASLLVAEAMNLLDTTVVQVAGPVIHRELGGSLTDIQWFSAAYTLAFALLLITGGRLGDLAGRRKVFLVGVSGFLLASLGCALAPSAGVLIVLRAVQGGTAALIIPQTFGLIKAMFDGKQLSRALGSIGPVMGLAAVSGPVLGGLLTHTVSWRAAFLINLPLGAAVLVAARHLPEDRAPERPSLDLAGTALAMVGIGLVVYPLIQPAPTWLVAVGVAVLAWFCVHQRRRTPGLFTGAAFPAALVTSTLFFAVTTGLMFTIVLHQQLALGKDVLAAGLTLLPWSLGLAVSSWVAGAYLVPRYGSRVMYAGLVCLLFTPWALVVAGVGVGLFTAPFFTAALGEVKPQDTGAAAGLLNAVQQVGGTLGVAVLGGVYLSGSLTAAFWTAAALLAATAVSAAVMS